MLKERSFRARRRLSAFGLLALCGSLLLFSAFGQFADEAALWASVRSGESFVMMRHALAPGIGDPSDFDLGDCSTQRNLSEEGRQQATWIGNRFRAHGIEMAAVFTSQWCRCRETGELMALGPVMDLEALNSFFRQYAKEVAQTKALVAWLGEQMAAKENALVLVTHQVNITAATDVYPDSGEMIVCRLSEKGRIEVVGRIDGWTD